MEKLSQKEKVYNILQNQGYIDNYYCIDTKLTIRLGAIIFALQREKRIEIDDEKSGFIEGTKNWNYVLKTKNTLF